MSVILHNVYLFDPTNTEPSKGKISTVGIFLIVVLRGIILTTYGNNLEGELSLSRNDS